MPGEVPTDTFLTNQVVIGELGESHSMGAPFSDESMPSEEFSPAIIKVHEHILF